MVRIRVRPVILGDLARSSLLINCVVSFWRRLVSSGSSRLLPSIVTLVVRSGYGQGRIKSQPSTIGKAVPSARVSKKPEVLPGKIVCAIVEKTKADNPKPETMIPVTVVLYIKRSVSTVNITDPKSELTILFGKLFATVLSAAG